MDDLVVAELQGLRGQSSVDIPYLAQLIGARRGTTVEISELEALTAGDTCGYWIPLPAERRDVILHAPTPSEVHRQQLILHELAHMFLRHDESDDLEEHMSRFIPDLPGVRVFARSSFHDELELAAERLADTLAALIRSSSREPGSFEGIWG
ncbi:hypothetical protein [Pseudoclavibacter helvolus]|uniref:hypothetical protein n=1 Tax=Pseudoclavibacter helvolus TaxID=255205 RepID=UPI003C78FB62